MFELIKSSIPGVSFPAIPDAKAAQALAMQYQFEQSNKAAPQKIKQLQYQQIQKLLVHASQYVPFYQKLFKDHNIKIPSVIDDNFFFSLPVIARGDVQQADKQIVAKALPKPQKITRTISTSGSTGKPVRIPVTQVHDLMWRAFALREHLWHQRDFSKKYAAIRWLDHSEEAGKTWRASQWSPVVSDVFQSDEGVSLHVRTSIKEQVQWLLKEKPATLISLPSNIQALVTYCLEHKVDIDCIEEVRTVGETVSSQLRELIKHAWGSEVHDMYSSEEFGYLAIQCTEHDYYHIQSENVILEILDSANQPCKPGETGKIVVSSLCNYAAPLIRYEIGDYAVAGQVELCSCGSTLPIIKSISGRKRNRLMMPSGDAEFPYLGEHRQFFEITQQEVEQFQFVQKTVEEIDVSYVVKTPFTDEQEEKIAKLIQANLGYAFRISFKYPQEIPLGSNGKFEEFISLVS